MNEHRFADLINLAERIPLKEYDQNTFGDITDTCPVGGKCGTKGCVAYHFALTRPQYGLAVHLHPRRDFHEGDFIITHTSTGYSGTNMSESFRSMAAALEIQQIDAERLFAGSAFRNDKAAGQKKEVLKRLKTFWKNQTGKQWRGLETAMKQIAARQKQAVAERLALTAVAA